MTSKSGKSAFAWVGGRERFALGDKVVAVELAVCSEEDSDGYVVGVEWTVNAPSATGTRFWSYGRDVEVEVDVGRYDALKVAPFVESVQQALYGQGISVPAREADDGYELSSMLDEARLEEGDESPDWDGDMDLQHLVAPFGFHGLCRVCGGGSGFHEEGFGGTQVVRFWDPDDGWRVGPLCRQYAEGEGLSMSCYESARFRGPRPRDVAWEQRLDWPLDVESDEVVGVPRTIGEVKWVPTSRREYSLPPEVPARIREYFSTAVFDPSDSWEVVGGADGRSWGSDADAAWAAYIGAVDGLAEIFSRWKKSPRSGLDG